MKRRSTTAALLFLLTLCVASANENEPSPARQKWIAETIQRLKAFKPSAATPRASQRASNKGVAYGINGNEGHGLIQVGSTGWVYIVTHSTHLEEMKESEDTVGDISIAVDDAGAFHLNPGHVCGGIEFGSSNSIPPESASDFFLKCPAWIKGWKWQSIGDRIPNTSLHGSTESRASASSSAP